MGFISPVNGGSLPSLQLRVFTPEEYGAVGDGVADDTAAWQACIDAAHATGVDSVIRCGNPKYALNAAPRHDRNGNAVLALPGTIVSSPVARMIIQGYPGQTQFVTSVTGQSYSASFGPPSLIGGPTVEQVGTTLPYFSDTIIEMYDIGIYFGANPTLAGIDLGCMPTAIVDRVEVYAASAGTTTPTSVYSFGLRMPTGLNSGKVRIGQTQLRGTYAGLVANTSHLQADNVFCDHNIVGLAVTGNTQFSGNDGHGSVISYLLTQECKYHIASWDPSSGVESLPSGKPAFLVVDMWDIEDGAAAQWYTTTDHLLDANNELNGFAKYLHTATNVGPESGLTVSGGSFFRAVDVNGGSLTADPFAQALGYTSWNINPQLLSNNNTLTSQTVYVIPLFVPYGETINDIVLNVQTAASGTATGFFVGLATPAGKMVAQSANLGSTFPSGTGPKDFALSAAYTTNPTDSSTGLYFVVILQNGAFSTTSPKFFYGTASIALQALGSNPVAAGTGATTGQTALPANGSNVAGGIVQTNALALFVGVH